MQSYLPAININVSSLTSKNQSNNVHSKDSGGLSFSEILSPASSAVNISVCAGANGEQLDMLKNKPFEDKSFDTIEDMEEEALEDHLDYIVKLSKTLSER